RRALVGVVVVVEHNLEYSKAGSHGDTETRRLDSTIAPLCLCASVAYFPGGSGRYCSASAFRFARPASKSLPIILSMSMKTHITLAMNALRPVMVQVTFVLSPADCIANSAVLRPSKGLMKWRSITIREGGVDSMISIRPV